MEDRKTIDLRSDTVTMPSDAMRQAAFTAKLGDDVFDEDPTVHQLEEKAAELVGKEAALFVASGTMANLVCVITQCSRGDEIILGDMAHIFLNEVGAISGLGGVHPHTLPDNPDGTLTMNDIEKAIRGDNVHWPRTKLICLENTHNRCYGSALTPEYMASVRTLSTKYGIPIHLDGARIFNAAVVLKKDVSKFTQHVDTVSFCLSKGLAAPIGSMVCGTKDFIHEARRTRKMLGGGMRQVGIIAAPGLVAIETMIGRLEEDHKHARLLAEGIAAISGLSIEKERVQTNILYFDLENDQIKPAEFVTILEAKGVKILQIAERRFRCVTHYGIERSDISAVLDAIRGAVETSIQSI